MSGHVPAAHVMAVLLACAWCPWEGLTLAEPMPPQPQLLTSSRLLKLGESIEFTLTIPEGGETGEFVVFPQYLERAEPGEAFVAGGDLRWVERLPHERLSPVFDAGRAVVRYTPGKPGSYLARWRVGGETLYRYFSAIEDHWVILRFSTFGDLESEPTLHATGLPLDYRLPAERFVPEDALLRKFVGYQRLYGDSVIPHLPDTPKLTPEERLAQYGAMLVRARELLPDPSSTRSARVECYHDLDPGYVEALAQLGVNDQCGLWEANANPWLGMPEFPYFASPLDCRKMNQGPGGDVVAHQWDFCGGWHFIGPVSWHYKVAEGRWEPAERCVRQGVEELRNLAQMSGHPAFAVPLYDGLVGPGYPNPLFRYSLPEPRPFAGSVTQVFIAPRALTADEIAAVRRDGVRSLPDALAAYPCDEGQGDRIHDASGRGTDGVLVDGVTWGEGPTGPALRLDGTGHGVRMERPVPLDGTDFTIGLWVKPAATQHGNANLLSSHNDEGGANRRGVSIEQDGAHTNRFTLIGGTGNDWAGPGVATQLQADVWQHFVIVRHGARITHYLDGEVSAQGEVGEEPFRRATDVLRLGNWARGEGEADEAMRRFIERYQRFIAFEVPKQYPVAFARSIDIADYYRRHFAATPRTIFVSETDHVLYDMWWLCTWGGQGILVPRERIPWLTRISTIMARRREGPYLKDPLSHEYVLVEDQRRSIRFERECPNPIWWSDYTHQERGPEGSAITHTETPDVTVVRAPWERHGKRLTTTLRMETEARFADYAICLWGLPADFDPTAPIETNAKEHLLAWNRAGEHHLVLGFDLRPGAEVRVTLRAR